MNQYNKERNDFHNKMNYISDIPPGGVDPKLWGSSIHELAHETNKHPLRNTEGGDGRASEFAENARSLAQTNAYLKGKLETLPIDIESLPAFRERILQDYDTDKPLIDKRLKINPTHDCEMEFSKTMDSLRKSQQGQPVPNEMSETNDPL